MAISTPSTSERRALDPAVSLAKDTIRIFARVRAFDIACPKCGRVWQVNQNSAHLVYNRRTGIFCCLWCRTEFAIGLIAYRVRSANRNPRDAKRDPLSGKTRRRTNARRRYTAAAAKLGILDLPDDWVPSLAEAVQLREYLEIGAFHYAGRGRATRRNILAHGCTCDLGPPLRPDPACPFHRDAIAAGLVAAPGAALAPSVGTTRGGSGTTDEPG